MSAPLPIENAEPKVLPAVVIEIGGTVERAAAGVPVLAADGWTPAKVDERLEPGTQIRTGLRSWINLRFGETTTISLRSATHASVDQCYRTATTERVKVGLGYGTVRGGSSEGELKSDVTVDSTVATLAKRGTEGWEMNVEPMTGRFRVSLAKHGLVEAIQKLQGDRSISRSVKPGEYATDRNIANLWINQDIFDRTVSFYEAESGTQAEAEFFAGNARGLGVLSPGGGTTLMTTSGRNSGAFVQEQLEARGQADRPSTVVVQPGLINRPEGNFGTGDSFRVLVPRRTR